MSSQSSHSNSEVFNLLDSRTQSSTNSSALSQYTCICYSTSTSDIGSRKNAETSIENMPGLNKLESTKPAGGTVDLTNVYAFLPLPEPGSFSFGVNSNWNELDLGVYDKSMVDNMVSSVETAADSMMNGSLKDKFSGIINVATTGLSNFATVKVATGIRLLEENLMSAGSGENKAGAIAETNKLIGRAVNPNKQLYFQGMNFESFNLHFKIAPLTPEDNKNLQDYIKALIKYSVPDTYKSIGQNYFTYPGLVKVIMKSNKKLIFEEDKLAITSVQCTPSTNTHPDGNPISYDLSIGFKETILRTRTNLDDNINFLK